MPLWLFVSRAMSNVKLKILKIFCLKIRALVFAKCSKLRTGYTELNFLFLPKVGRFYLTAKKFRQEMRQHEEKATVKSGNWSEKYRLYLLFVPFLGCCLLSGYTMKHKCDFLEKNIRVFTVGKTSFVISSIERDIVEMEHQRTYAAVTPTPRSTLRALPFSAESNRWLILCTCRFLIGKLDMCSFLTRRNHAELLNVAEIVWSTLPRSCTLVGGTAVKRVLAAKRFIWKNNLLPRPAKLLCVWIQLVYHD